MKPKLKTEIVRIEYWDCGNPDHRHKTNAVALRCCQKREKRIALGIGPRKWTNEAYATVLSDHREGARKCDLARSLHLSPTRVAQILKKAERIERKQISLSPLDTLSVRTRNCLLAQNLHTIEEVRAELASGRLDDVPNFGARTKGEVQQWLDGLMSNAPHKPRSEAESA